ncbi:unnamed protein product, partial [Vitis vinifera]
MEKAVVPWLFQDFSLHNGTDNSMLFCSFTDTAVCCGGVAYVERVVD